MSTSKTAEIGIVNWEIALSKKEKKNVKFILFK